MGTKKNGWKVYVIFSILLVCCMGLCLGALTKINTDQHGVDDKVLAFYRQYGPYTDPG